MFIKVTRVLPGSEVPCILNTDNIVWAQPADDDSGARVLILPLNGVELIIRGSLDSLGLLKTE